MNPSDVYDLADTLADALKEARAECMATVNRIRPVVASTEARRFDEDDLQGAVDEAQSLAEEIRDAADHLRMVANDVQEEIDASFHEEDEDDFYA